MNYFPRKQILELAERYSYKSKNIFDEGRMKEWLKNHRYLNKNRFIDLCSWKSVRQRKNYKKNNDSIIKEITRFSFSTKSEEARIESLRILKGVEYPVASAILHFAFPQKYPIMDFRVIWSLGWEKPQKYDFNFWQNYCKKTRELSNRYKLSIRTIDKALWVYSKENQKK